VRRVLITGGAGFIGSHVAETLLRADCAVLVVDNLVSGSRDNVPAACDLLVADITDVAAMTRATRGYSPDAIVHLAAQTDVAASVADPGADAAVNVLGTLSVLQAGVASRCRKVIFASSSTVYGEPERQPVREDDVLRPVSPYGISKLAGEQYVRVIGDRAGMAFSTLRLGNVVGPRDRVESHHVVTSFVHALMCGEQPAIEWDGEQTKDYVYVVDVAEAVLAALDHGDNRVFNIATEAGTSVKQIFRLVSDGLGLDVTPIYQGRRPGDVRNFVMDCSRARRMLRWHARTSLADAVVATMRATPVPAKNLLPSNSSVRMA
jgi:UDP-glucose 4-epimerase